MIAARIELESKYLYISEKLRSRSQEQIDPMTPSTDTLRPI